MCFCVNTKVRPLTFEASILGLTMPAFCSISILPGKMSSFMYLSFHLGCSLELFPVIPLPVSPVYRALPEKETRTG